jgi:hypothetical protein
MATDTEVWMWYGGTRDLATFGWGLATAPFPPIAVPETSSIRLGQNFPNPFNPRTTIQFTLAAPVPVLLEIYDAAGRRVRRLIDGRLMIKGSHQVAWDGRDDMGRALAAGVYFYRLDAGDFKETMRMVLVK